MKLESPARDLFRALSDALDSFEAEHQGGDQDQVREWVAEALGAVVNLASVTGTKAPVARILHYADAEQRWLVKTITGNQIDPESQVRVRLRVVGNERQAPPLPSLEEP